MIYFNPKVIYDDIKRFQPAMKERYELADVDMIEKEENGEVQLGYGFEWRGKRVQILMAYDKNHLGQMAIKKHIWNVFINGNLSFECRSIGDVFEDLKKPSLSK